jgi:radical SAM superfamily enzyme YgiQ (UPF0313 family)
LPTDVLLITPPFTQINTPYPATAYLKGFLNTRGISAFQADLGLEVSLALFSSKGLKLAFEYTIGNTAIDDANMNHILAMKDAYLQTIDAVVKFLQGKDPTLAYAIVQGAYLPQAGRFKQAEGILESFGSNGLQDKAKFLASMYLEDIGDLISTCVDPHFGFSRYAEKLGRSANSYDELYKSLQAPLGLIDQLLILLLEEKIALYQPKLVAISVPFPGNLFAGLRCGQYIKHHHPTIKVAMGGGFANTELRSLKEQRVFECVDFICLDDGEAPLEQLCLLIENKVAVKDLKRTFTLVAGELEYISNNTCSDYKQAQTGTPDYSDLLLDKYISVLETANPMHSLWSDGRWNKLTMAHGCYWAKCTFCDISLDYIAKYEPLTAAMLCDRIEAIIAQTGNTGFHFVDEAAPPTLMRALAIEIIKRKLNISWWTNIRFEKSFTRDLCFLLKASGCIAVSGGLEVASDRLLALIDKGITVEQVVKVNKHFTEASIMVHAYLMYGFPTETEQETIDSLEMVRQMFEAGIMQSAYWHLFTMTAHSPVGLEPEKYKVKRIGSETGLFANNDLEHEDNTGADHEKFADGLRKALHNYMHHNCLDVPLYKWFEAKVPKTIVPANFVSSILNDELLPSAAENAKVVYAGNNVTMDVQSKSKKGNTWEIAVLNFYHLKGILSIKLDKAQGEWLMQILPLLNINNSKIMSLKEVKSNYEAAGLEDFELFWDNKPINTLYKAGLWVI